jgi:lipopolysaccharide/colanic/teichoic acid biosynthesis glycosyltransferase
MAPDPTPGHLSDPGPASGHRLSAPRSDHGGRSSALVRLPWETRYVRSVIASDAAVIAVVCAMGVVLDGRITGSWAGMLEAAVGPVVALALLVATHMVRAWDPAVLGDGSAEYRRVARGYAATAAVLGLAGLAAGLDGIRLWIFGIVPAACLFVVAGRFALRKALHRRRATGDCSHQVLAVGAAETVADLILRTRRNSHHGWTVTGICTPTGTGSILGVPVVGDLDAVAASVRRDGYRIVSVSAAPGWSPRRLHMLAWELEEVGAELVVDPVLTELAGPRLRVEPVDELPLVRLTRPTLGGASLLVKSVVDRTCAALLLLMLAPLLLVLAVAIRASGGPVMRRQIRVGRGGKPFTLLRFRCGSATSHPVDAVMRRYALDELPQLFNVLGGSMSLVGPRPPVPGEHGARPFDIHRTYPIKPGLTGLRQVSGGTEMSSEERARLDVRYVQNWSLAQDAVILWKAARAGTRTSSV